MTHSCATLHFPLYSLLNLTNTGSAPSILLGFRVVNAIEKNDFGALAPVLEHSSTRLFEHKSVGNGEVYEGANSYRDQVRGIRIELEHVHQHEHKS